MDSIPFPFEPYTEQKTLMNRIYSTLDKGGIALLESPTGTGKSLSIICSSLHWLINYNKHNHKSSQKSSESTPDWVNQFFHKQQSEKNQEMLMHKQELLRKQQKNVFNDAPPNKRQKLNCSDTDPYLVRNTNKDTEMLSANDWIKLFNSANETEEEKEKETEHRKPQIIYCSRTHSQLLQFVNEIKKTKFNNDNLEILTLGSRKQLCIHPKISKCKSVSQMNDACLNLKDSKANKQMKQSIQSINNSKLRKKPKIKIKKRDLNAMRMELEMQNMNDSINIGCPYLKKEKLKDLSLRISSEIYDIEECHKIGKQMQICPYYSVRKGINSAHLIAMPYTSLIHSKTRKSLGINLKQSIIIIDEAHNLIENINQIHSVKITLVTLQRAYAQLNEYKTKYINRLKHANITKIKTVLKVLNVFIHYLKSDLTNKHSKNRDLGNECDFDEFVVSIDDLLFDLKIDHINFYDLIGYIDKSDIIRKLHGFIDKQYLAQIQNNKTKTNSNTITKNEKSVTHSPLTFVVNIFEAFANMDSDGKLIVTKHRKCEDLSQNSLKFIHLNPFVHFKPILSECHALILCGGTMQPISHFIQQLFPQNCIKKALSTLSCSHVVHPNRVLCLSLPCGPCNKKFDFTFKNRFNSDIIQDLGRAIVNFAKIIHAGIVIFFPSFQYLQFVLTFWQKSTSDIYRRLSQRKRVLVEPKSSTEVDGILQSYNDAIYGNKKEGNNDMKCDGAILLCVVGGKMSEGIDFKDELARLVVMVGLPYPNPNNTELKERMTYLNKNVDRNAGAVYYQNLCMRAVNQSIGRAIRHKMDYGCILLMDYRYVQRHNIYECIPDWIKKSYLKCNSFQKAFQPFCKFINSMKKLQK